MYNIKIVMTFKKFTVPQLREVIRKYNLYIKNLNIPHFQKYSILNYSRMKKEELINEIEKHLLYENNNTILIKEKTTSGGFNIKQKIIKISEEQSSLKNIIPTNQNLKLIDLKDIKDIIKRFVRGDIEDNKKQWEDNLIYSLKYQYENYTIKYLYYENRSIYEYLKHNIDEMEISIKTKIELEKLIEEHEYLWNN